MSKAEDRTSESGAGVSDEEYARQVAGQTDPNLKAEDVFERAPDAAPDAPAEEVDADDLR